MRAALKTSSNRAAVRMLEDVGIPVTVQYAKRLGVGSVPSVPSLALGSGEVTLSSMTAAYAAFANGGMVQAPILVRRVETTEGEVLYNAEPKPRACRQRRDSVPHVEHDGGRRQCGHRSGRTQRRVPSAGCRKDRDDQRLPRCVVRRFHSSTGDGCVGWLRPAANDHRWRIRVRACCARLGTFHGGGNEQGSPRVVQHARQRHVRNDLPSEREAGDGLLPRERDGCEWGDDRDVHGLHRVFRHGHRADRVVPDPSADPLVAVQSAGGVDLAVAIARRRRRRLRLPNRPRGSPNRRQHRKRRHRSSPNSRRNAGSGRRSSAPATRSNLGSVFSSVFGHRRLLALLSRALARDTLPPALLLAGPSGVGKRRVAMAIARAVNCLEPRSTS